MPTVLKSRIPQIMLSLKPKVDEGIHEALSDIASDASGRAPRLTGELSESIEAREEGIYAAWYWFFPEFGTTTAPAQPYMIPALEAGMDGLHDAVENALEDL